MFDELTYKLYIIITQYITWLSCVGFIYWDVCAQLLTYILVRSSQVMLKEWDIKKIPSFPFFYPSHFLQLLSPSYHHSNYLPSYFSLWSHLLKWALWPTYPHPSPPLPSASGRGRVLFLWPITAALTFSFDQSPSLSRFLWPITVFLCSPIGQLVFSLAIF